MTITALIAEDEPLLRAALHEELAALWPTLSVVSAVDNGDDALAQIRQLAPSIAFLDIRMPGLTGIEVAQALVEDAEHEDAVPLVVFVTAYSEFAVAAFDNAAIDYVLKPFSRERLQRTVERLQQRISADQPAQRGDGTTVPLPLEQTRVAQLIQQLTPLLAAAQPPVRSALKFVRVGQGSTIQMIATEQVRYFQAADKYLIVATAQGEGLIRESLRDMQAQLDREMFVQIHRGTLVNMAWVERAQRDEAGHVSLKLRGLDQLLPVSRVYAHLFRAM